MRANANEQPILNSGYAFASYGPVPPYQPLDAWSWRRYYRTILDFRHLRFSFSQERIRSRSDDGGAAESTQEESKDKIHLGFVAAKIPNHCHRKYGKDYYLGLPECNEWIRSYQCCDHRLFQRNRCPDGVGLHQVFVVDDGTPMSNSSTRWSSTATTKAIRVENYVLPWTGAAAATNPDADDGVDGEPSSLFAIVNRTLGDISGGKRLGLTPNGERRPFFVWVKRPGTYAYTFTLCGQRQHKVETTGRFSGGPPTVGKVEVRDWFSSKQEPYYVFGATILLTLVSYAHLLTKRRRKLQQQQQQQQQQPFIPNNNNARRDQTLTLLDWLYCSQLLDNTIAIVWRTYYGWDGPRWFVGSLSIVSGTKLGLFTTLLLYATTKKMMFPSAAAKSNLGSSSGEDAVANVMIPLGCKAVGLVCGCFHASGILWPRIRTSWINWYNISQLIAVVRFGLTFSSSVGRWLLFDRRRRSTIPWSTGQFLLSLLIQLMIYLINAYYTDHTNASIPNEQLMAQQLLLHLTYSAGVVTTTTRTTPRQSRNNDNHCFGGEKEKAD